MVVKKTSKSTSKSSIKSSTRSKAKKVAKYAVAGTAGIGSLLLVKYLMKLHGIHKHNNEKNEIKKAAKKALAAKTFKGF